MSKVSDLLEQKLVILVENYIGRQIPFNLPRWLIDEGVRPGARIVDVDGIGSKSRLNKTDVLIILENSAPIKISAKLANADYFGNWYSHKRFLDEFGFDRFLLNSDMSNKPSDPLSVPKTIRELTRLGYKNSQIEKISHENAANYFKI